MVQLKRECPLCACGCGERTSRPSSSYVRDHRLPHEKLLRDAEREAARAAKLAADERREELRLDRLAAIERNKPLNQDMGVNCGICGWRDFGQIQRDHAESGRNEPAGHLRTAVR